MVFVAFIFCAEMLLPGAVKQLPPAASIPSEAFPAGMCGVPNVLYIYSVLSAE